MEKDTRKYIYELCVSDTREEYFNKDIIMFFEEQYLPIIIESVKGNPGDMSDAGSYNYAYIDKVEMNRQYPKVMERMVFKWVGNDTFEYVKTETDWQKFDAFYKPD